MRIRLFFLAVWCLVVLPHAAAQENFVCDLPGQVFKIGDDPEAFAIGDIDGDSTLDFVFATDSFGNNIRVLKNDGLGAFQLGQIASVSGDRPSDIAVGDLDGQHGDDVAVVTGSFGDLYVFLSDENGELQPADKYPGIDPTVIALCDLDGDSDLDIVAGNPDFIGDSISVFLNNGSGQFAAGQSFSTTGDPERLFVKDLDLDGDCDVVIVGEDGSAVMLNDGAGNFPSSMILSTAGEPAGADVSDVNADSIPDLVVLNDDFDSDLIVFTGNGDGTFSFSDSFDVGFFSSFLTQLSLVDIDGDQDLDAVLNGFGKTISTWMNTGSGTFEALEEFRVTLSAVEIAMADIDGDQDNDLLIANTVNSSFGGVLTLRNFGNGTFENSQSYLMGDGCNSVVLADLDADGDVDVATANQFAASVSVRLNAGDSQLDTDTDYDVGTWPLSMAAGDLDGDNDIDLVTTSEFTDSVSVLLNHGDGSFAADISFSTGDQPQAVAVGDWDGDSDLDLVVGGRDNLLHVLNNDGRANFTSTATIAVGAQPISIVMEDIDGDGDLDLISANLSSNNISLVYNEGFGFSEAVAYPVGSEPESVAAFDLNEDNAIDLVVANSSSDDVSLFLNNGDGTFAGAVRVTVGSNPRSVTVGDLNGDSLPDVVATNADRDEISVLFGEEEMGNVAFRPLQFYSVENLPRCVAMADLDGDQNLDICTANSLGDGITILRNFCILYGDVNLDGNVDLLDVSPFVDLLASGGFQVEADVNRDGTVDLLDVAVFVQILSQ